MPSKREQREMRRASAEARRRNRWIGNLVVAAVVVGGLALLWFLTNKPAQTLAPPEVIALGQDVYAENCAACHGDLGQGHVLAAAPALDASEHAWHHPDRLIQQLLVDGGQTMPAFGEVLTDEEIVAVIRYIQTWWTADQIASQQQASEEFPMQ
jgi:mono/diheme cytochrome c family protein